MVDYSNIPRDSRRVPLETRVQFKFDRFSGFISEYSANISPGGMFLRMGSPRPPGTVLDFEFRLGDGFELIKGRGEVIWARAEDEGPTRPAGMGIRFLELSEGSRDLIYRIVDEHILQGGTPFDVTQRPPDPTPAPAREAVPAPLPDLAGPPSAPPARAAKPVPDASSWLPPPAAPLPERLSRPAPKPQTASPPPATFAPTFGSSSLHRPPRRILPWVLLAGGLISATAAFLLGDRLLEWTGLGGPAKPAPPAAARPTPGRTAVPEGGIAVNGAPEAPPSGAASTSAPSSVTPTPAAPAPSPVSASQPPAGPVLTRLDRVTWEPVAGGTDVILWGNGEIPPKTYQRERIDGNPPRELIRLSGVQSPQTRVVVGTAEVLQVRTGYHPEAGKGELYVVLDLAHPAVAVTGLDAEPHRLRIHLRRR